MALTRKNAAVRWRVLPYISTPVGQQQDLTDLLIRTRRPYPQRPPSPAQDMRKWASTRAFRTLDSHTMLLRTLFAAAALLSSPQAQALPGQATTPQALGITLALRGDEARNLVLLKEVRASQISLFRSSGGRTYLKFKIEAEGQAYEAIMYQGEWNAADREQLAAGPVDLVGVWGTFANQPSLAASMC